MRAKITYIPGKFEVATNKVDPASLNAVVTLNPEYYDEDEYAEPTLILDENGDPVLDDFGDYQYEEPQMPSSSGKVLELSSSDPKRYVETLLSKSNTSTGLLPPAVRYISKDNKVVVFERPPTEQMVEVYVAKKHEVVEGNKIKKHVFNLPIPWQVYIISFDELYTPVKVYCYFRTSPLTSLKNNLYLAPMVNFYNDSSLCNPTFGRVEERKTSMAQGILDAYNEVWNSGWNYDLTDAVKMGIQQNAPVSAKATFSMDAVASFYNAWSQITVAQALNARWPNPAATQSGGALDHGLKLDYVISNAAAQQFGESDTSYNSMFIVNLMNAFSI